MKLKEVIFIDSFPTIDLHGLDRDTARVKVLEFIKDNKIMGNEIVNIIHGRGSNVLKNEVHSTLKNNKDVVDFKLSYNNPGSTIVQIKL